MRSLITSLRTFINSMFYPSVILIFLTLSKIIFDLYCIFSDPSNEIMSFYKYFFNDKFWNLDISFFNYGHIYYAWIGLSLIAIIANFIINITGFSKLAISILRDKGSDVRNSLEREDLFRNALSEAQSDLDRKLNELGLSINYSIKIIDSSILNAVVFSDNLIIITTGLLKQSISENNKLRMLKGVISHELGHIHNKDTVYNQISFCNFVISDQIKYNYISNILLYGAIGLFQSGFFGILFGFFFLIVFGWIYIIIGIFYIFNYILNLTEAYISREQEYNADMFSINLGFQDGLLDFLYQDMEQQENLGQLYNIQNMSKSAYYKLFRTHPVSHNRILNLEQNLRKESV